MISKAHMDAPHDRKKVETFENSLTTADDYPADCPGSLLIKSSQKVLAIEKFYHSNWAMNTK